MGRADTAVINPSNLRTPLLRAVRDREVCGPGQINPPLSILLFLHSYEAGGVERVALRLAGAWQDAGYEVHIAMGRRSGPLTAEQPRNVTMHFARPSKLAAPFESLWLVPHLINVVRKQRPAVLFCAGNTYAIVAILARLLLGRECPPILCKISNTLMRTDMPYAGQLLYRIWLKVQGCLIDHFVAMADSLRAEIQTEMSVSEDRISIISDPAISENMIKFVRRDNRAGGRHFLGAGRLVAQKNYPLLLRAFASIAKPDDRLTVIGEGIERRRLERLAQHLGIREQLELPGHVADPLVWIARADALILSSEYEGLPAVLVEALAVGTPIVATHCSSGIDELLNGGELGIIVPGGDQWALATAMERICERDWDRNAMAAKAACFTVERSARKYAEQMRSMAGLVEPDQSSIQGGKAKSPNADKAIAAVMEAA